MNTASILYLSAKESFSTFIREEALKSKTLLLMVSGGVDSMVLLQVASQCHDAKDLHVLHINHQTRDSNKEDEKIVQNFCSKFNIPCTISCLSMAKGTTNQESKWREKRAKLSSDLAQKIKADRILTAHHATDLVETMLFRLTKGCGVGGLAPFDTSTKPFWQIPKTELIEYAQAHDIEWREDPTNDDEHHQRNLIRHQVLPALRKITPNLEKVFIHEHIVFEEVDRYMNQEIDTLRSLPSYPVIELIGYDKALQREILRSLTPKTPSFDEMEDFFRWIEHNPRGGSQKELGGLMFRIEKGNLRWD